jgi:hypothetical protein
MMSVLSEARTPTEGIAEMIATQPVLDSPTNRLLTYTMTDEIGAKVIISLRASIADDDLVRQVMSLLAVPRQGQS